MTHADPDDRPPEVFDAVVTRHRPGITVLAAAPGDPARRSGLDVGYSAADRPCRHPRRCRGGVDAEGITRTTSYWLLSGGGAAVLLDGSDDLDGARVCFMVTPGWRYVAWQWAIWRAGGVAVPSA